MTVSAGATGPQGTGPTGTRGGARRSVLRVVVLGSLALGCSLLLALMAGFAAFTARIANHEPVALRPADAIVVLTGGASRVTDGMQLLSQGHGRRMLISGVNRTTSADELRRTLPSGEALLDCCVDLGRKALNTWGNAIEVAEWTRQRDFRSLIVVTSAWHMPRALYELNRIMPEVELLAYPVVTDKMQDVRWWSEPQTAKLLMKEYVKYLLAHAKIRPLQAVAPGVPPAGETPDTALKPPPGPQASTTH